MDGPCLLVCPLSVGTGAASIAPKDLDLITPARPPLPCNKTVTGSGSWDVDVAGGPLLSPNHIVTPQAAGPFFLELGVPALSSGVHYSSAGTYVGPVPGNETPGCHTTEVKDFRYPQHLTSNTGVLSFSPVWWAHHGSSLWSRLAFHFFMYLLAI